MATHDIDLRELSDMTGVSLGSLSLLRNGQGNPTIKTVTRVCNALDISIASVLGGEQA